MKMKDVVANTVELTGTRQMILQQAEELFAARGYNGVSMREIAEACQVSKAAIYYHFKNKEDLYIENMVQALEALKQVVKQASSQGADCRERMTDIAIAYLDLMIRKKSLLRLAAERMSEFGAETEELAVTYHSVIHVLIEPVFADGVARHEFKPINVSVAAMCFIGMLNAFIIERIWGGRETESSTHQDLADQVVNLLLNGITV